MKHLFAKAPDQLVTDCKAYITDEGPVCKSNFKVENITRKLPIPSNFSLFFFCRVSPELEVTQATRPRQRSITEKHVRPLRSPMLMIRVTWSPNKAPTVVAVGSQNLGKMMHSGRICNMQLWIDSMVWIYIIYNTSSPTNMFFFSLDVTICFFTDEVYKASVFLGAIIFTCLKSRSRCFGRRGVLQLCGIFGH